jgi:hypothetical protein
MKKEIIVKKITKELKLMELNDYNPNISYCGMWKFNKLRTKFKIHKILPFNKFCPF